MSESRNREARLVAPWLAAARRRRGSWVRSSRSRIDSSESLKRRVSSFGRALGGEVLAEVAVDQRPEDVLVGEELVPEAAAHRAW